MFSNDLSPKRQKLISEASVTQVTEASKHLGFATQSNTRNRLPLADSKLLKTLTSSLKPTQIITNESNNWNYDSHMKTYDSEM